MPADALPVQRKATALPGTVIHRRVYLDPLGRPMRGTAMLTPQNRAAADGVVVVTAPVPAEVVNGVLEVKLPPGAYRVEATLLTVDNVRAFDADTIILK